MMTCIRARELLPLLLYEDLTAAEASEVRCHLQQCPGCQQEFAALGGVRQALAAMPAAAANVNLEHIYASAARLQHLQVRRWRRAAGALTAVAAVLLVCLGLKLEVRCEPDHFSVRWGAPPAAPPPPPSVVVQPPAVTAEDLQLVKGLIQVLMADLQDRDRQQQQALRRLQLHLETLQRQHQQRLVATERDVTALYTAQFGTRGKGD